MFEDEKRNLQALSPYNRWLIVSYLHYLLWRQFVRKLPVPLKLGGAQTLAMFGMLTLMPPDIRRPALIIPTLWAASVCVGIIAVALLPHRSRVD